MFSFCAVNRHVLVTDEQCSHRVRASSAIHITPPASRLGVHKNWEETQLWQLTPTHQRDIPYHMTSYSAVKLGGSLGRGLLLKLHDCLPSGCIWPTRPGDQRRHFHTCLIWFKFLMHALLLQLTTSQWFLTLLDKCMYQRCKI